MRSRSSSRRRGEHHSTGNVRFHIGNYFQNFSYLGTNAKLIHTDTDTARDRGDDYKQNLPSRFTKNGRSPEALCNCTCNLLIGWYGWCCWNRTKTCIKQLRCQGGRLIGAILGTKTQYKGIYFVNTIFGVTFNYDHAICVIRVVMKQKMHFGDNCRRLSSFKLFG